MLNGLYSAASGMLAQQTRMDMLANDLANVNTTGYKQARIGFRDLIYNPEQGMRVGAGLGHRRRRPRLRPRARSSDAATRSRWPSPAPASSRCVAPTAPSR